MQEVPVLGKLCDHTARRDCVHVALAPVEAGTLIEPGESVKLVGGLAFPTFPEDPHRIGVADPFLTQDINRGEKFFLLLLPGSITGLRHVWTHPAFKPRVDDIRRDEIKGGVAGGS